MPSANLQPTSIFLAERTTKVRWNLTEKHPKNLGQTLALCAFYFCTYLTKSYFPNILVPCQRCQGSLMQLSWLSLVFNTKSCCWRYVMYYHKLPWMPDTTYYLKSQVIHLVTPEVLRHHQFLLLDCRINSDVLSGLLPLFVIHARCNYTVGFSKWKGQWMSGFRTENNSEFLESFFKEWGGKRMYANKLV